MHCPPPAVIKLMVARPLKVNFSLTKLQQAREYAKRLQAVRTQELTKVPREVEEIRLMTTPRAGEKSVGISLPGIYLFDLSAMTRKYVKM